MATFVENLELSGAALVDVAVDVGTLGLGAVITGGAPLTAIVAERQNAGAQGRPPDYLNAVEATSPVLADAAGKHTADAGFGLLAQAAAQTGIDVADKVADALNWTPYVVAGVAILAVAFFAWPIIRRLA